jgi:hypothetical protein
MPSPCYPPINQISHSCISEEANSPSVLVVKNEVPDYGSSDQAGEGKDVGDGVDVFMGCELGEDF